MKFPWPVAAFLICFTSSAFGQAPVSNPLTPAKISEGWINLFDGATKFGWKEPEKGTWAVADGALQATTDSTENSEIRTTTAFGSLEFNAEVMLEKNATASAGFTISQTGDTSTTDTVVFGITSSTHGKWVPLDFIVQNGKVSRMEKGKKTTSYPISISQGYITLGHKGTGKAFFRNVRLLPLQLQSIFNGHDLMGWKVVPGHNSVFTVTPDGNLNIRNGNGDIQTERTWGDLVLQIEVYSNGDHLNSGVFFRGEPGMFWQGYEDQIRNQWEGEDRNKAVDYGTGGIYNRQPARRVVSSDREWFTMTLIAHGNHIGSWVNGVMVADFTDTRPPDQTNARKGARTAPGVISLQGHDPTTDLSFRKIHVAELPTAKL